VVEGCKVSLGGALASESPAQLRLVKETLEFVRVQLAGRILTKIFSGNSYDSDLLPK
jgi:hypothetical protein